MPTTSKPTCEGVHECGQGTVEHLEERVSYGVLLGAAESRVFQDVGRTRVIVWGGTECHSAKVVGVGEVLGYVVCRGSIWVTYREMHRAMFSWMWGTPASS